MDTLKAFFGDVINTISSYVTPEALAPLAIGFCVIAAFWEWVSGDSGGNNKNE